MNDTFIWNVYCGLTEKNGLNAMSRHVSYDSFCNTKDRNKHSLAFTVLVISDNIETNTFLWTMLKRSDFGKKGVLKLGAMIDATQLAAGQSKIEVILALIWTV